MENGGRRKEEQGFRGEMGKDEGKESKGEVGWGGGGEGKGSKGDMGGVGKGSKGGMGKEMERGIREKWGKTGEEE